MSCTAEEIAKKRREAQERLKKTKELANKSISPGTTNKPTSNFYGNTNNVKANTLNQYENKMKQQPTANHYNRISSQPYPRNGDTTTNNTNRNTNGNQQKFSTNFTKIVNCTCTMISSTRFQVIQNGYNESLINVFKTIPTRAYGECFFD